MGIIKKLLMKIARKILGQVLDVIMKQINRVQSEVLDMLMGFVNGVDEIWQGEDAEAFKAEFASLAVPKLNSIVGVVTRCHGALMNAADRIDQADSQVRSLVGDLVGDFNGII